MSRRKQARPRHVDDPDLESPAISTNPVATAVFNDNVKEDDKVLTKPEEVEEEIEDHSGEVLPENRSPHTPNVDAHVCGKCRAEFLELDEFVSHKKQCCKPVVLLFKDDNEGQSMEKSAPKLYNGNVVNSCLSEDQDEDNFDSDMSHNDHSDDEKDFENLTPAVDEIDAGGDQEKFGNQSDFDEDFDKSLDDDENDLDSLKGENPPEKPDKNGDIPPYMQPLSNLLPAVGTNPHSNVMLEPLEATKAAVAQFAENNLPEQEKDVTRLHSTLYNLQQQQIMQLQLIHQLQQQLVASGMQNSPLSAALLNSQIPLGTNFQGLNLNIPGLSSFQQSKNESPKSPSISESPSPKAEDQSAIENEKETPSEPSSPQHHSSETLALSSKTVVEVSKSSTLASSVSPPPPTSSSYKSEQNTTARSSPPTPALDYSRSSSKSGSEGQGYIGGDDPFFKHKCRLCHKVFGSDSALQIHVRSHTDTPHHAFFVDVPPLGLGAVLSTPDVWTWEKPFLCNICGGRFSTRGNLKVHFQRHKAEFPNVEMNPNPVPEHMDKNPMPLLGSPFPAAALTPFANPTFMGMQGLMNGFMFPPPHLAPRPPMPSMMPKHHHEERERRQSSPSGDMVSRHPAVKKEVSPSRSISEAHQRSSSDNRDSIKVSHTLSPSSAHMSKPSPAMPPIASIPLVSNYPVMSPLPSQYPYNQQRSQAPTSLASSDPYKPTILPSNVLDNDDSLEQFMEISKSETSKLQQLVDNIEHKLTDPNQCVICHRVLSCKSALQMHYRIHTGERPFKCKICGRSFTTKGNLKTHMGVHRAKPPLRMMHQCPVCHKQFTNLLVLQQHIRSHTGMSSLPMMPSLSHLNMYGRQNMDAFHESPLNMKRQFPEDHERELDLSKKPRLVDDDENKVAMEHLRQGVEVDEHNDDVSDIDDDDDNEQNEMDDEANKLAAKDAKKEGLKREDSEGRSTPGDSSDGMETKPDETDDRPKSNQSDDRLGFTDSIPRSSSPKYLQEDSNMSQEGSYNAYSTSLAALEERVRAIDSTMARNPLSQFHAAPFLLAPNHYTNGDRALSPRSESGSDSGEKKPLTPALSVSSNGSIDNNFMIGAMDVRAHMDSKTSTTCNVCYKTFACRSALDIHYRSHTRERPYKCDMCDKSFTTRGNMRQHLLTHKLDGTDGSELENNNNSCTPNQNDNDSDRSGNSSPFGESPQEKMRKDLNESQGSVSKKDVTLSEKSATSLSSPPSISTVTPSRSSSSAYTSPSDNQSPFISKTPTVKHQCLVCQKGFSGAGALQIHIRTHTGDKPFKCTVCGKAFTTKGNLKVHMGTHMWNNSPSRRGRRMSIEPPFMLAHKENPYLPHGFPPRPDFYPFQFPPFMNGLPTPPKSLSEISVIPGMTSGMGMKPELMSPHADLGRTKSDSSPIREEKPKFAESGELDLSMKSTGSSGSRSSEKTSPSSIDSNSSSGMVSPPHMSLGWGWKASCHLCSRSFPTPAALEHHVRSMHMVGDSLPKVAAS